MADRYWVGGTASWDGTAGTKWATTSGGAGGASVPTSVDAVFFTNLSTGTCTISTGNTDALSINCTGFTGTLAGTAAISVAGSVTLVTGQTYTYTGVLTLTGTGTLTTGGKTLGALVVSAVSGTVTLGSALTSSAGLTISNGTLTTSASNYSITATAITVGASDTLTLNGSTVTITGISGFSANATATINAGTSTINLSNGGASFNGGGKTYNNVSFTSTAITLAGGKTISGANVFNTLTFTAPTIAGVSAYVFGDNQTITTFVCAGGTAITRVFLTSDIPGTQRTLTVTTWSTISDVDFCDIGLNTSRSGTRLGNGGGNLNITFPAAKTVYWNLTGSQNWSATGWATTSGGTPALNNFPLLQDTAVFDNTGAATTVTVNAAWGLTTLDMSGRTSAMTFTCAGSNNLTYYGNFINGSGVTLLGTGRFTFAGRAPQTITTAGNTVTQPVTIASVASSVTLQDALTISVISSNSLGLESGTFDTNGYNVTLSGGSFNGDGATARTLTLGASVFSVASNFDTSDSTNLTVTGSGTINLTSASQKSFNSGSADYSGITIDQAGAGLLVFGNAGTLGNISNSYASTGATTIRFGANQTIGNFTASGQAGRVLTIISSVDGVARTLTKTSGVVAVDYLNIRDSTATGGATWYAGANSVNTSNNTGWIFTAAPGAGGSFLMLLM